MYCSFSLPLISLIAIVRVDSKQDVVTVSKLYKNGIKTQKSNREIKNKKQSETLLASTGKKKDERLAKKRQFTVMLQTMRYRWKLLKTRREDRLNRKQLLQMTLDAEKMSACLSDQTVQAAGVWPEKLNEIHTW